MIVPQRERRGRFEAGQKVGNFELLETSGHSGWKARCACGEVVTINPYAPQAQCTACNAATRTIEPRCETCGTEDPKRFSNKKTECGACERRRHRAAARGGRPKRLASGPLRVLDCEWGPCSKPFETRHRAKRFCSEQCTNNAARARYAERQARNGAAAS